MVMSVQAGWWRGGFAIAAGSIPSPLPASPLESFSSLSSRSPSAPPTRLSSSAQVSTAGWLAAGLQWCRPYLFVSLVSSFSHLHSPSSLQSEGWPHCPGLHWLVLLSTDFRTSEWPTWFDFVKQFWFLRLAAIYLASAIMLLAALIFAASNILR